MRRLYIQIYLAFLAILVLFAALVSAAWWSQRERPDGHAALAGYATLMSELLPPAGADAARQQAAIARIGTLIRARLTLRGPDGALIVAHGDPLPPPPPDLGSSEVVRIRGIGHVLALRLGDGRWALSQWQRPRPSSSLLIVAALLLGTAAVGAYPLARRITRRLERLQSRVEALGAGDLSARVAVEGKDEVALLASRFNQTAERIEKLVAAQRSMLAGASHELRSPLARLRVAVELMSAARPEIAAQAEQDIGELDALIDELLLASRLDTQATREISMAVDLSALVAEETAHYGVTVGGPPVSLMGDEQLLRRLVRNLLENARRHAAGSPVEAEIASVGGAIVLRIADRGPGVPEAERERFFEPFYRPPRSREGAQGGVGLGLALVRRIAQRHGGSAVCRAREGGGAVFEVRLPRRQDGQPAGGN